MKEALRSIANRTVEALGVAVTKAFSTVTAMDCRGFFPHCGYATEIHKTL